MKESEDRFRRLTRLSSDWYWEQDEQFRFVRLLGDIDPKAKAANEIHVGKTRWEVGALNLTESDWEKHRGKLIKHQEFRNLEMQRKDTDGNITWVSTSGGPVFDSQGKFKGYQGVARDITESKLIDERIKHLAFFDGLTNLPNRRLLNDRLLTAIATSKRVSQYGAVMFVDLDDFKPINDRYGHEIGDKLLIEIANRLKKCVREIDTAARFGGDEFVIVVSDLATDADESFKLARGIAEKVRSEVAKPHLVSKSNLVTSAVSLELRCTASIGVTLFNGEDTDADAIIRRADTAMYCAKDGGHNTVELR